jgi:hypothetical protein
VEIDSVTANGREFKRGHIVAVKGRGGDVFRVGGFTIRDKSVWATGSNSTRGWVGAAIKGIRKATVKEKVGYQLAKLSK